MVIPKSFLAAIGVSSDGDVDMAVEDGRIVIRPAKAPSRKGWALASQAIAAADEAPTWPEFGNEHSQMLCW